MPFQPEYEVPEIRRAYTEYAVPESGPAKIGCLMLHGFMGSPASSRDMGRHLAENGITVHCPLLPGHGHLPYKIHNVPRQTWIDEAEEGLAFLRRSCDQVFIIGHSMGGVLAAHLALQNDDILGLILLAPLYDVPDKRIKLSAIGRYFMKWFYPLKHGVETDVWLGRVVDYDPSVDVNDPKLQEWLVEATRLPLSGIDEMCKMGRYGRKLWSKLRLPVIIFQGGRDPAVSPGNSEKIYKEIPFPDKTLKFFPQVGHELMRPVEPIHSKVWEMILEFIEDHSEADVKRTKPTLSN